MRGSTNAVHSPKKVLIHLTGHYYRDGRATNNPWYLCMDTDQLSILQEFLSDLDKCIAVYGKWGATPATQMATPWNSGLPITDGVESPPTVGSNLIFRAVWPNVSGGFTLTYTTSASAYPTERINTYTITNGTSASAHTTGEVGYFSFLKVYL